jgi:hypothetical protein
MASKQQRRSVRVRLARLSEGRYQVRDVLGTDTAEHKDGCMLLKQGEEPEHYKWVGFRSADPQEALPLGLRAFCFWKRDKRFRKKSAFLVLNPQDAVEIVEKKSKVDEGKWQPVAETSQWRFNPEWIKHPFVYYVHFIECNHVFFLLS